MSTFKIRITTERRPFHDGRPLSVGEEIEVSQEDFNHFKAHGWCEEMETKKAEPKKKKKRARNSNGHYIADDPKTAKNEAYVDG